MVTGCMPSGHTATAATTSEAEDMASPGKAAHRRQALLVALLLCLAVAVLFRGAAGYQFLKWDDDIALTRNPHIGPLNGARVWWALTDWRQTLRYQPLAWLNWLVLFQFFGLDPTPFHLEGILLHAANAGLVFWLILRLLEISARPPSGDGAAGVRRRDDADSIVAAALAAAVWAFHPLRAETVAWVTQERFGQSLFLSLIALLCYLRAADGRAGKFHRRPAYWLAVLAASASVLSYPATAMLPVVLAVLDVYPLRRHATRPRWRVAWRLGLEKAPFLVAPALALGVTLFGRVTGTPEFWAPVQPMASFGLLSRAMQAAYIWAYYVWRPFLPIHLSPAYMRLVRFSPAEPVFLASALLLVLVSVLAFRLRGRAPGRACWPHG